MPKPLRGPPPCTRSTRISPSCSVNNVRTNWRSRISRAIASNTVRTWLRCRDRAQHRRLCSGCREAPARRLGKPRSCIGEHRRVVRPIRLGPPRNGSGDLDGGDAADSDCATFPQNESSALPRPSPLVRANSEAQPSCSPTHSEPRTRRPHRSTARRGTGGDDGQACRGDGQREQEGVRYLRRLPAPLRQRPLRVDHRRGRRVGTASRVRLSAEKRCSTPRGGFRRGSAPRPRRGQPEVSPHRQVRRRGSTACAESGPHRRLPAMPEWDLRRTRATG